MNGHSKIKSLEELEQILSPVRGQKTVVHCHGVFDLLHIGHIRYLNQAKKYGDVLVVTLTRDAYVNKGPHRPAFPESIRAEVIASLDCVDYVAVNHWPTAVETIHLLKPDIYAKGAEFKAKPTRELLDEKAAIEAAGGEMVFIEDITSSSSSLLNKHFDLFSEDTRHYLHALAEQYAAGGIMEHLEALGRLKVLIIGEAILDEYQYCEAIGKSSKEPTLAARYLSTELHLGGSLAVANHVANFCDHAEIISFTGSIDSYASFIRPRLHPNLKATLFDKQQCPTIIKRRFIENYFLSKFFEVYVMDDRELNASETRLVCDHLRDVLPEYDAVIVADFGHGVCTPAVVDLLGSEARFLAVNTQVNAGNRGFNTISKYPRADYICLAENELRIETRNRHGDLKEMMLHVSDGLNCPCIMITRGKYGSICYHRDEGFFETPALATRVVDRVGAGDAVFALTSLCVAGKVPAELVGFIGNVVGAEAVNIMGNQRSIEATPLQRHILSLLK